MNRPRFVVGIVIIVVATLAATTLAQRTSEPTIGRFQLVASEVLDQSARDGSQQFNAPALFMVDTQTGRVWRFQSHMVLKVAGGSEKLEPAKFFPVEFPRVNTKNPTP